MVSLSALLMLFSMNVAEARHVPRQAHPPVKHHVHHHRAAHVPKHRPKHAHRHSHYTHNGVLWNWVPGHWVGIRWVRGHWKVSIRF